jgi:hypothetical protein
MPRRSFALLLAALGSLAGVARAEPPSLAPPDAAHVAADTVVVGASRFAGARGRALLLRRPGLAPDAALLGVTAPAARAALFPRPVPREASRLRTTLLGADRGAYAGLAAGFLGEWLGVWDERTALAIMGAGAAAGALWGGTLGYEDPGLRIRVRSDP